MRRENFFRHFRWIRARIRPTLQALGTISFSVAAFVFAVIILEGLYRDSWDLGVIYILSDVHSFFTSDAGKPVIGPIVVILGGAVGWITTRETHEDKVFWISFAFYALADAVLLFALIMLSPPVSRTMSAVLESYDMNSDDNPMKGLLSIAVAALSGWLANRITKRSINRKTKAE